MKTYQDRTYVLYRHTNKENGKAYIGITAQKPEDRWKCGKGYDSMYFSRAIKKYGWDGFNHEILLSGLSRKEACEKEKELIKEFDLTNPEKGYNQAIGGESGGMYKKHHSEEAKEKIRAARLRDGFSDEHKRHISDSKKGIRHHFAKPVYQYTKDGEFVKKWEYMSLAATELNINKANIGETCNGNRKSAGGFFWSYKER